MATELIYLLKVNLGITLFYAFYKLCCGRDTFFKWRRTALLGFLALSFLYPSLDLQRWTKELPALGELAGHYAAWTASGKPETDTPTHDSQTAPALRAADTPSPGLQAVTTAPDTQPGSLRLLVLAYLGGVLLLSVRFAIQLWGIFRIASASRDTTIGGIRVKSLPSPANPFSFGPWIFVYLPGLKDDEREEVLAHELTHVRQCHSIDVMAGEVMNIACWMNPFAWLLKEEIRLNLEYLADHTVTRSMPDIRPYQYHLLGLACHKRQSGLYNSFNVSHLKNRIIMMNKKRTRTTGRVKYALFAPLAAALLLASNIELTARTAGTEAPAPPPLPPAAPAASVPQAAEKGHTFYVTVVDKDGKAVANVNIQTQLGHELKNFRTGADGKATVVLELGD